MSLPKPPAEVPVQRSTAGLAPKFRRKVEAICARLVAKGHDPLIAETLRTDARQHYLFGFGRKWDDGRGVVTYSQTARDTWHGYGLAVDIVCRRRLWNATPEFWRDLGEAVNAEGMCWGNDWDGDGVPVERDPDESFSDRPHVQWKPARRKPSDRAAELLRAGGMPAVWSVVGAE